MNKEIIMSIGLSVCTYNPLTKKIFQLSHALNYVMVIALRYNLDRKNVYSIFYAKASIELKVLKKEIQFCTVLGPHEIAAPHSFDGRPFSPFDDRSGYHH